MDTATIARLLIPFAQLSDLQLQQISRYLELLVKWNARINLTAVRVPGEMVTRHFGESFFAAGKLLSPDSEETVIDLGSGAGFPGLPLALYAPRSRVTLIESNGKKAAFLNEVVFTLGIKNVKVFSRRAEEYPEQADLVTMRAVENFEKSLSLAVRLVRPGGRLALMVGVNQIEAACNSAPQVDWGEPISVPGGHSRVLLAGARR